MEETREENENILEDADYSNKTDFSKAAIVKAQVDTCCKIRSKEMREGYVNYDKMGNKIQVPDARREFISAIKVLKAVLAPEINRSEDFKKKLVIFDAEEKKIFDRWAIGQEYIENGTVKTAGERKFIPEIDQLFPVIGKLDEAGKETKRFNGTNKGKYNINFHSYWNELVNLYDKIFAELNVLVDECDYFRRTSNF